MILNTDVDSSLVIVHSCRCLVVRRRFSLVSNSVDGVTRRFGRMSMHSEPIVAILGHHGRRTPGSTLLKCSKRPQTRLFVHCINDIGVHLCVFRRRSQIILHVEINPNVILYLWVTLVLLWGKRVFKFQHVACHRLSNRSANRY